MAKSAAKKPAAAAKKSETKTESKAAPKAAAKTAAKPAPKAVAKPAAKTAAKAPARGADAGRLSGASLGGRARPGLQTGAARHAEALGLGVDEMQRDDVAGHACQHLMHRRALHVRGLGSVEGQQLLHHTGVNAPGVGVHGDGIALIRRCLALLERWMNGVCPYGFHVQCSLASVIH